MEIQKIFTDLYDDERIYSVLMNENELYLFSEIQKEFTGVTKIANKAAKRAWQESIGKSNSSSSLIKNGGGSAVRSGRRYLDRYSRQDPLSTSSVSSRFKNYKEMLERGVDPNMAHRLATRNASAFKAFR